MKPRTRRGLAVVAGLCALGITSALMLSAFQSKLAGEGKGVVAQGKLGPDGAFRAEQVLAKHDENDMPPEAAMALEKARHGQPPATPKPGAGS